MTPLRGSDAGYVVARVKSGRAEPPQIGRSGIGDGAANGGVFLTVPGAVRDSLPGGLCSVVNSRAVGVAASCTNCFEGQTSSSLVPRNGARRDGRHSWNAVHAEAAVKISALTAETVLDLTMSATPRGGGWITTRCSDGHAAEASRGSHAARHRHDVTNASLDLGWSRVAIELRYLGRRAPQAPGRSTAVSQPPLPTFAMRVRVIVELTPAV